MKPRLSVAQIKDASAQLLGSCFFLSTTKVLTCSHVIVDFLESDRLADVFVHWLGERRCVNRCNPHSSRDAAVLEIASPFGLEPMILQWARFTPSEDRKVSIHGFNNPHIYELEHLTRFIRGYAPEYDLGILDSPALPGFSGSPAIINDFVVGIVVAADKDRTFIIPTTALYELQTSDIGRIETKECILDVGSIKPVPDWGSPAEVKFTLTNAGRNHLKIISVCLHVQHRERLLEPHHFLPGAIVKEYELKVHLTPDIDHYELISAPHVLGPGETDGFRLQVTSDDGWHYSLLVRIRVKNLNKDETEELEIGLFDLDFRVQNTDELLKIIRDMRCVED